MIAVEKLSIAQGTFRLDDISFVIPTGCYGVLMGRTGCGKTSILEAVCGLRPIAAGRVALLGRDVTRTRAPERGVGYVPQDRALFPTMTVRRHLGFALEIRRRPQREIERRVAELAEMLGLGSQLDRHPAGLSGGEAQRVALGRALAARPRVLCLDEPLAALDEETRGEMISLLHRVNAETGVTALHVTHSPTEAAALAGRLFRIEQGRVAPA